jgi:hypothetical protein
LNPSSPRARVRVSIVKAVPSAPASDCWFE